MDPKHILMRLGLRYLADYGDRILVHKSSLFAEGELDKLIRKTKVLQHPTADNYLWIWVEK
jgi:hypothetical protein